MSGELRVVSAEAVRDVLEAVAVTFTARTGCAVSFAFMTAGQVRTQTSYDVAITSQIVADELVEAGKAFDPRRLGRIGLAIAIPEDAVSPDIATPEKFVAVLTAARAVAYTDPAAGGTGGLYVSALLKRLGIADAINRRAVLAQGGRDTAERVAIGEADLGLTFPSEILPVSGAKVGAMLPEELQNYVTYAAVTPRVNVRADQAAAFIDALTGESARLHWRRAGFAQIVSS